MLTVAQRHPQLEVLIVKNTALDSSQPVAYTLTARDGAHDPVADVIAVQTHKDIGEVAGTFSLKLVARRDRHGRTWAHLIEPMDYVEIHLQNTVDEPGFTTVMRGFVDVCQLMIGTGQDGSPQTYVLIEGRDYGKLFLRQFYFMLPSVGPIPSAVAGPQLAAIFAVELGLATDVILDPGEWLTRVWRIFSDPKNGIAAVPPGAPSLDIIVGESLHNYFVANVQQVPFTGSIWNYISYFISQPFFEMFITDDVEQPGGQSGSQNDEQLSQQAQRGRPVLVWRRSPYKVGQEAQPVAFDPDATFPDVPDLSLAADVITMQVGRHDQEAYSYFFTLPTKAFGMDDTGWWSIYGKERAYGGIAIWDQALTRRFGFLPLDPQLQLWPANVPWDMATADEMDRTLAGDFAPTLRELTDWLYKVFRQNYLYEQGTLSVRGNANIRIGRHVRLQPTGQYFYIEAVDHNFSTDPLSFQTTVTVTRGTWPDGHNPYSEVVPEGPSLGLGSGLEPPLITTNEPPPEPNPPVAPPPTTAPAPCHAQLPYVDNAGCTQAFGQTEWEHPHLGVDIGLSLGSTLVSPVDGVVQLVHDMGNNASAGYGGGLGLGNYIEIRAGNGDVWVLGHMLSGSFTVSTGQRVGAGQIVGFSGNSGDTTGPHLHIEYHPGGGHALDASTAADPASCLTALRGRCAVDENGTVR
jgi:murein DD-endopeptidase MepM/ murein hydrolase activator NlpD